jgi:hypothetical protein
MAKGMQGLASSHISAGLALSMWAYNLLNGEDRDEEGDEYHTFEKILRATPLGVGGMALASAGMYVWTRMFDKDEAERRNKSFYDDKLKQAISPYMPLGTTGYEAAEVIKKGAERMIDRRYLK